MSINNFKTGPDGIKLIKDIEKLELHAYQKTINGVPDKITIGYGHTGTINGRPLNISDKITTSEADKLFKNDLLSYERTVNESVKVPINQNQFDALVSLSYNIGPNAFKNSTLLKLLNKGDFTGTQKQFYRWNKVGGKDSLGLTRRRAKEADLFNKPPSNKLSPYTNNIGQSTTQQKLSTNRVTNQSQAQPLQTKGFLNGQNIPKLSSATPAFDAKVKQPTRTANTAAIATTLLCSVPTPMIRLNPIVEATGGKATSVAASYFNGASTSLTDAEAAIIAPNNVISFDDYKKSKLLKVA